MDPELVFLAFRLNEVEHSMLHKPKAHNTILENGHQKVPMQLGLRRLWKSALRQVLWCWCNRE